MPSVFIVADTHFGHEGVCKFLRNDGTKLRPWDTAEEMDAEMIELWNKTVKPADKVYHLGDVVMRKRNLDIMAKLNGDKVLIKGNHDILKLKDYLKYFRDIRAYHVMDRMILSHIPVHPGSKGRFRANIHGHTHANRVLGPDGEPDPWYIPVSVEHTGYRPVLFERIRDAVR